MEEPRIFLAMPAYGPVEPEAAFAFYVRATEYPGRTIYPPPAKASLLANLFNAIWLQALQTRDMVGATHFAMLHADVEPATNWLDTLHSEIERLAADVVSVVIPIKDGRGLTSTAIERPGGDLWEQQQRLTMREVLTLPETFGPDDVGGRRLLVNTGCWICDLRKPWVDRVEFRIQDRIGTGPDGTRKAQCIPEDWDFSCQVQDAGGKVYATRKVKALHLGSTKFGNDRPWGAWSRDEAFAPWPRDSAMAENQRKEAKP